MIYKTKAQIKNFILSNFFDCTSYKIFYYSFLVFDSKKSY